MRVIPEVPGIMSADHVLDTARSIVALQRPDGMIPWFPGGHVRIYRRSQLVERLEGTGMRATGHHHAHGLHAPYWWLKCLVGTTNDQNWLVKNYHRLLVWDIMKAPRTTRYLERVLAPLIGKSIVVYLVKPVA